MRRRNRTHLRRVDAELDDRASLGVKALRLLSECLWVDLLVSALRSSMHVEMEGGRTSASLVKVTRIEVWKWFSCVFDHSVARMSASCGAYGEICRSSRASVTASMTRREGGEGGRESAHAARPGR